VSEYQVSLSVRFIIYKKAVLSQSHGNRALPRPAAILDLIKPEIALFDPPTLKTPPHPGIKHEVYRITCGGDIPNIPRWRPAAILNLIEPEMAPFDPPTPKTLS